MEFVGRRVRKEFEGNGMCIGTVRSYKEERGVFEIAYEDGNSEELELSGVMSFVVDSVELANDGNSAKKQRSLDADSSGSGNLGSSEFDLNEAGGLDLNLNENYNVSLSEENDVKCRENEVQDLNNGIVNDDNGIDCSGTENEGVKGRGDFIDLNLDVTEAENLDQRLEIDRRNHSFDLNLGFEEENKPCMSGNGEGLCAGSSFKGGETDVEPVEKDEEEANVSNVSNDVVEGVQSEENLCGVVVRDEMNDDNHCVIGLWASSSDNAVSIELVPGSTSISGSALESRLDLDSMCVSGSEAQGTLDPDSTSVAGTATKVRRGRKRKVVIDSASNADICVSGSTEQRTPDPDNTSVSETAPKGRRGRKRKVVIDSASNADMNCTSVSGSAAKGLDAGSTSVSDSAPTGRLDLGGTSVSGSTPAGQLDPNSTSVSDSTPGGNRGRKRKAVMDSAGKPGIGTVLRRSARRASISAISDQDNGVSVAAFSESENNLLASPVTTAVSELDTMEVEDDEGSEEDSIVLPPKVELPSSSENLDLQGMPTLDVFSVYSFLRSFSTLLFLSPFELEDFVASVKSNEPSVLFDSIHVSLLQTLWKHLESLSDDSSQSASLCLRSLDWGLLDLTTWPVFLAEYLLLHSCSLRRDIDLGRLRLVENDYYKQSPSVKIEILRCLCDDSIEVEAIKSELNKRTYATELGLEYTKKRKNAMDVASSSCLTEEDDGENLDWNSDECCLCKMEGSLICCDGCPAAFHSRCVGVSSTLLPEGDWFCPECVIDKDKPWLKMAKSIRGANPLGIDAYGRLFYISCGYLLVSEDYDVGTLVKCYHRNDLPGVIDALKVSKSSYEDIIAGITNLWLESSQFGTKNELHTQSCVTMNTERHSSFSPLVSGRSKSCLKVRAPDVGTEGRKSAALGYTKSEVTESIDMKSEIASYTANDGNLFASSEGSTEVSQVLNGSNSSSTNSAKQGDVPTTAKGSTLTEMQYMSYVNYYSFARIAAAVAEDFLHKSKNRKPEAVVTVEEIISDQLKSILSRCIKFSYPGVTCSRAGVGREKCGWCFSCKSPEYERECLITMTDISPPVETFTSDLSDMQSREHKEGHFIDLISLVFNIEARLRGLLLGPWLDPHYSQLWHKSLLRASDIASLKFLLLKLESNLNPRALSEAWVKHVDSAVTMGSGVFVKINAQRVPSKSGSNRKKPRILESETTTTPNSTKELSSYWWRGGRLSRALFNWRVLPRSLASKAARQAGCKKIPDLLYPDSPEFPTRSKYVAWRADVESSKSVEQLAFQVRQLYANIRWDDIENKLFLKLDKDPKNPIRSFKKASIRRKCTEGTIVKYLLDFGKRRFIPDIVLKKGCKVEEGTNEKKKFWLEECYVPLFLLKAFEEKRIARMLSKLTPGKSSNFESAPTQPFKKKGFEYLFSRAEKPEYYQCGHCSKDVLIREAVSCQRCKGFFHIKHVKKSGGAISAKCRYTCHRCSGRKIVKFQPNKEKLVSEKIKRARGRPRKSWKKAGQSKEVMQSKRKKEDTMVVTLRRSPRKLKCFTLKNKKVKAQKKEKQEKSKRGRKKKQISWQRKRTKFAYTYWLNGLHLTRKRNDERVKLLKAENKVVVCGESTSLLEKPTCSLCNEPEFCSWLNYVSCEICGDWYHEDAYDHRGKNISRLVGFKCHKCLKKNPPLCPHLDASRTNKKLNNNAARNRFVDKESKDPAIPTESIKIDLHLTFESKSLQKSECSSPDQSAESG